MDKQIETEPHDHLTERERMLLALIAEGLSNDSIAERLVLSSHTVKWHVKQIFSKLGVERRTQAVAVARTLGLLDPQDTPEVAMVVMHNLPAQVTSFVGRERELAEVRQVLKGARLVTLIGPPGTGKTRLALQVAGQLVENYAHGVYFVNLAPLTDPDLVLSTVAAALEVNEQANRTLAEALKGYLRGRQMLLVLDNFEQVVQAAAHIGELLASAPRLKVLATSREVLRVYGEHLYEVPPLGLPNPENGQSAVEAVSQSEAGLLFIQRARAARSDFEMSEHNAGAVAEICRRLDGLPLAIELAAARTRTLTPKALVDRLGSRLEVLAGGPGGVPARQQTLRATIDWSYNLLDENEKQLFARLSVFQGRRRLEAIEAVCGPDLGMDTVEGVESLLAKSLLRQVEDPDGEPRYVMLETIHEYARECLAQGGEAEAIHKRHAEYFADLSELAHEEWFGKKQPMWITRLGSEQDNLRAALAWSVDYDVETAARIVAMLSLYWPTQGYELEGLRWADRIVDKLEQVTLSTRVKFLVRAGNLPYAVGDLARMKAMEAEGLTLARAREDKQYTAWALIRLSGASMGNSKEHEQAVAGCREGLTLFREIGDLPGMAEALNILGELERVQGHAEGARAAYEESLAISRETGEIRREVILSINLGFLAERGGDHHKAYVLLKEALRIAQEMNWPIYLGWVIGYMAGPLSAIGQPERAARLLGASEAFLEERGTRYQPADQIEVDRIVASVRAQLDEDTFEAAWAEGRAMSLEEAIDLALSEGDA